MYDRDRNLCVENRGHAVAVETADQRLVWPEGHQLKLVAFFIGTRTFTTNDIGEHRGMKKIFAILVLGLSGMASGTTYYVSSSGGSDSSDGTTPSSAWKTLAKVNAQTYQAGDSILLKRGDVWNESLVPPSSGAAENPIVFDAYGLGAPPNLTGYYEVPTSAWVKVTGNAWKASLPAGYSSVAFCLFGSVWGQKVGASSSNLLAERDFYLANGSLYVYSAGDPGSFYGEPIVPMALSNTPVIHVNGKSWLTFQHLLVNWFDQYGVYVHGASDHIVFANMETDSMIPQGTQPLGFYVSESGAGPGDIKIYNSEGLFGSKSGAEKKDAAMSFLESALATVDAVAAREIVDPVKFKQGVGLVIDGVVQCLNASAWAKSEGRGTPLSQQP